MSGALVLSTLLFVIGTTMSVSIVGTHHPGLVLGAASRGGGTYAGGGT